MRPKASKEWQEGAVVGGGGTYKSHQLGGRRAHLMAGMREGKNVVVVQKGTIEANTYTYRSSGACNDI